MLILKKSFILINYKNLFYSIHLYKLNCFLVNKTLKKINIWMWPLVLLNSSKIDVYLTNY